MKDDDLDDITRHRRGRKILEVAKEMFSHWGPYSELRDRVVISTNEEVIQNDFFEMHEVEFQEGTGKMADLNVAKSSAGELSQNIPLSQYLFATSYPALETLISEAEKNQTHYIELANGKRMQVRYGIVVREEYPYCDRCDDAIEPEEGIVFLDGRVFHERPCEKKEEE